MQKQLAAQTVLASAKTPRRERNAQGFESQQLLAAQSRDSCLLRLLLRSVAYVVVVVVVVVVVQASKNS